MASFNDAKCWMLNGKKICRPSWMKNSYWSLGSAGVIIYSDGEPAKIHINQTNAYDWEIWRENKTQIEIIKDGVTNFMKENHRIPNKIRLHPKAIKQLNPYIPKRIMGMEIIEDDSIKETEAIVYYEEDKATLSYYGSFVNDKIGLFYPEDKVKKAIKNLMENIKKGLGPNHPFTYREIIEMGIKEVFGLKLTEEQ